MVSITHTVSMPKELWDLIFEYVEENNVSRSNVFQSAIKLFFKKEKDFRFIDVVIVCILFVIILLLMGVML